MRAFLFMVALVSLTVFATSAQAQTVKTESITASPSDFRFEKSCDSLCQAQRELDIKIQKHQQEMQEIQYQKALLEKRQKNQIKLQFESDTQAMYEELGAVEYTNQLCKAECDRIANLARAKITAKYKGRWEATFPMETLERCADRCPSPLQR